ncbi:MAG: response regulator transcription factor [Planctomycetales bacterium]|nr:response regulator transcription factor [Planctomycetales bacterium]
MKQLVVLVAEDDTYTRKGLCEVLQNEGFQAIGAADGMQAIDLYQRLAPDFVCLDVMMPGHSGFDVCGKIRALNPQVPIIFITAKGEEIDKLVGLELGADDYIVKPFGVREVVARIRAVARRCLSSGSHVEQNIFTPQSFQMADLVVFPAQLRARRGEQTIDLSFREVRILLELFRRSGSVVDRQTLMHVGWGQEYLTSSRTLDQHISQLRKRIELDPKHPQIIQTVHGAGYRYEHERE